MKKWFSSNLFFRNAFRLSRFSFFIIFLYRFYFLYCLLIICVVYIVSFLLLFSLHSLRRTVSFLTHKRFFFAQTVFCSSTLLFSCSLSLAPEQLLFSLMFFLLSSPSLSLLFYSLILLCPTLECSLLLYKFSLCPVPILLFYFYRFSTPLFFYTRTPSFLSHKFFLLPSSFFFLLSTLYSRTILFPLYVQVFCSALMHLSFCSLLSTPNSFSSLYVASAFLWLLNRYDVQATRVACIFIFMIS